MMMECLKLYKVEKMGSGIKRMRGAIKEAGLKLPKFELGSFFRAIFYRPQEAQKEGVEKVVERVGVKVVEKVTENQKKILDEIATKPFITSEELANIIGISERKTKENLKKLKDKNLIRRVGPDKGGHWEIVEKETK